MIMMKNQYNLPCNIAQTLNIIGDKWTLLILYQLLSGHHTFQKISENLQGIPTNLLSSRLKTLEENQLITLELYQNHPPRYNYLLTESGKDLEHVLNSIFQWGEEHLEKCNKKLIHKKCKSRVDLIYYCSCCKEIIHTGDIEAR